MKKLIIALISITFVGCASIPTGCPNISELNNTNTPADIFKVMGNCIAAQDYDRATQASALAGVYGRFDTLRIKDDGENHAMMVLRISTYKSLDQDKVKAFQNYGKSKFDSGSIELANLCAQIQKLGPPNYVPTYMLSGPFGIYTSSNRKLISNFDASKGWASALDSYLHCPK